MGSLKGEGNPTEHFEAEFNMCSKILLQLAVLTYIANVPSQQKYLLVEVDDDDNKELTPEISNGGLIGTFRKDPNGPKADPKHKGKPTPKPKAAGKPTGKPAAKAVPCDDVGKACYSSQECCSTICLPKAAGKGGRRKRLVDGQVTKPPSKKGKVTNPPGKKEEPQGKCAKETKEESPAPKDCAGDFKKQTIKYPDAAREESAVKFRNYEPKECDVICRESSGCLAYLYAADMKDPDEGGAKDEENGCWLYYHEKDAPALKRDAKLKVSKDEIACQKVAGANGKGGKATEKPEHGKEGKATAKPKYRSLAMHPRDYADNEPRLCDSSCSLDALCKCWYKGIPRADVPADCPGQVCRDSTRFICACQ